MNLWDEKIYSKKKHWNLVPFNEVISAVAKLTTESVKSQYKILEIGCGVGNNIITLAKQGFNCFGMDISHLAITEAQNRCKTENIKLVLSTGNVNSLDYTDNEFDFVIDRSVLTCTSHTIIQQSLREIFRVLKPTGKLLAFDWYGLRHPDLFFGEKLLHNSFTKFSQGIFLDIPIITACDFESLIKYTEMFSKVEIRRSLLTDQIGEIYEDKFKFIAMK